MKSGPGRIIGGDGCVAEGAAWLAARDARFADLLARTGPLPLRLKPDGFGALMDAILGQQVSTASAAALWTRIAAAGLVTEDAVAAATQAELRACGLSRQKVAYVQALARAGVNYEALRDAPDEEVIARLTALPGIGRWTAEVYAMQCLGRADVFAPGDLALQEAARDLFALSSRPTERVLRGMSEDWRPWRAVAARALWAYYRLMKSREGIR